MLCIRSFAGVLRMKNVEECARKKKNERTCVLWVDGTNLTNELEEGKVWNISPTEGQRW